MGRTPNTPGAEKEPKTPNTPGAGGDDSIVDLGYNKEYIEYAVKATPHTRPQAGGGRELHKFTGVRGEVKRTKVRLEPFRADQLNSKWPNRGLILLEVGDETKDFEIIIKP